MHPNIKAALDECLQQHNVSAETMQQALGAIMDGECSEAGIAALLTGMAVKGETSEELAGAAQAMRTRSLKIQSSRKGLIDTCGTGGDNLHTFNISTATAIVVAACGVPVAKHGNRSVSSSSGSADVLEALGVNIELSAEQAGQCLDEIGICFCYARLFHGAMKHVAPVRRELGFRTMFNLLGPLTNPAGAEFQLLGANSNANAEKIAHAACQLGTKRTLVVCGNNELDEVSLWGTTQVWDVQNDEVSQHTWTADDFGLNACTPDQLRVSSAQESADVIRKILRGEASSHLDIVVANSSAALFCAGQVDSINEGVERVLAALKDGLGEETLKQLVEKTNQL